MEFRFGIGWAIIVLSLSVIAIISEGSQYDPNYNTSQIKQGYSKTYGSDNHSDYSSSYLRSLQPSQGGYNNQSYGQSSSYGNQMSPSYGHVLLNVYGYNSSSYSYHKPGQNVYQVPNYNRTYQQSNYGGYNHSYQQLHYGMYNRTILNSPYQTVPGMYQQSAYDKQLYTSGGKYDAQSIYSRYLATGAYQYHSAKCSNHYGQTPQLSSEDMEAAFNYAHQQLGSYDQQYGNYSGHSGQPPVLKLKEKEAILMELVTEYFAKYKCLSKYQTATFLPAVRVGQQYISGNKYGDTSCYSSYGQKGWDLQCPDYNSPYRKIDGSCNNRYHPYWGKSYVCHIRLLPPDYANGVSSPRMSSFGEPLPSSRTISNILAPDLPFQSYYNSLKEAFGQFVNHDITNTPTHGSYAHTGDYSGPVDCCKDRYRKQCYPIDIPQSPYDYQYRNYKNTCLDFVRSAPCPLCDIGPRQQMNTQTSFIDGSTIYGSELNESIALRTLHFGLLRTSQDINGNPILPSTNTPWDNLCNPPASSMKCFTAGDTRVNQHPGIMTMHTLFLRYHNIHATALRIVNSHWDDERLYQQARRLTIAQLQHMTYNEYFPIIFGPTLMNYYSLYPRKDGYTNYEAYTDPTSWNDYAAAACRFGHSQTPSFHGVYGYGNLSGGYMLRDRFHDPYYIWQGQTDGLVKGLLKDRSQSVDPYVSNDLKNYLFRKKGESHGSDLIAKNVQRGRDHGIPGYVNYLKYCFGYEVRSWDDLRNFIPVETLNLFRQVYKNLVDIDFYIGGLSERHFPDGDVGPTFACVLGIQYYHVKFGDRYFYEHGGQSGSFSLAQLDNIRQTSSIAQFLCKTGDYLDGVQRYAFFPESNYNPKVPCKNYPGINYKLWKESN